MQRGSKRRKRNSIALVVRTAFEPSRLAEGCLAEAYGHAVPVLRRATRPARPPATSARRGESLGEGTGP